MLTSSYPRSDDDTASVFIRYLAQGLRDVGHDVHVIAPADAKTGTVVENGITVKRFSYFPARWQKLAYGSGILSNMRNRPLLWLQVPFFALAMTWSLIRSLRDLPRPTLIHAHWVVPQGLIAAIIGFMLGAPVVVSLHGSDAFTLNRRPLSSIKRFCLRRCTVWTANTHATAEAAVQGHVVPSPKIIPMGVDTGLFGSGVRSRLRAGLGSDERIVLYVGRLVEKKGIDDLMLAYARLDENLREKTRLWIIGRGDKEAQLKTFSVELGIKDRVIFWGQVPNSQLPDFYAAADLLVNPSIEEGQGVVFIEAFAAHLCVLATRVGGIPEVVDDGRTGILVSPRNPVELAAAMQRLLTDKDLRGRLARNAQAEACRLYAWPKIVAKFSDLYKQVISIS